MKDLNKLYHECVEEMKRINMDISNRIVGIKVNGRLSRSLGRCRFNHYSGSYSIEINPCMLADSVEVKTTKNTIIHELIHTCPGCMNHGYECKRRGDRVNRMLGYNVQRCAEVERLEAAGVEVKKEEYKYALECVRCGHQFKFQRWCSKLENPSRWKCGNGCGGDLKTVCLDGSREIWGTIAANRVE